LGPVLEVTNLEKRYGATHALANVSVVVSKGSVHGIIGENGAGKSTLIKLVSGLETPDAGTMLLDGREFRPRNIGDARRRGVSTAFQELGLLPNMTVAENLFLPRLRAGAEKSPFVPRRNNERAATDVLAEFGLDHISPSREVGTLSLAERQKLEIARAINHKPQLLLLDEPTAALPDPEWLYAILAALKSRAPDLSILYISHRLNEIRDLCESITVLRNGNVVKTIPMKDADRGVVMSLMAGSHEFTRSEEGRRRKASLTSGTPTVKVDGLCGEKVLNVSFTLHEGEILGVAGLGSQGQREVFRMLAGVVRPSAGSVEVDGRVAKLTSPSKALRHGISFVPEDRKLEGILPGLRTLNNVSIASLAKAMVFGFILGKKELAASLVPASIVDLSPEYLHKDVDALSGGNQQKAVVARSLMRQARCLLLYDPSRGVDVGTKASLYDMMRRVTDEGVSILWYSTDLQELTSVCDRIIAFYRGTIVAEMEGTATLESLMHAITGQRDTVGAQGSDAAVQGQTPDTAGDPVAARDGEW
jgi:ribose transport system ATP-binding protein